MWRLKLLLGYPEVAIKSQTRAFFNKFLNISNWTCTFPENPYSKSHERSITHEIMPENPYNIHITKYIQYLEEWQLIKSLPVPGFISIVGEPSQMLREKTPYGVAEVAPQKTEIRADKCKHRMVSKRTNLIYTYHNMGFYVSAFLYSVSFMFLLKL